MSRRAQSIMTFRNEPTGCEYDKATITALLPPSACNRHFDRVELTGHDTGRGCHRAVPHLFLNGFETLTDSSFAKEAVFL